MELGFATIARYKQVLGIVVAAGILVAIFAPIQNASAFDIDIELPDATGNSVSQTAAGEDFEVTIEVGAGELISVQSIELILDNDEPSVKRTVFNSAGDFSSGNLGLVIGNDLTISSFTANSGYGYGFGLVSSGSSFSPVYSYAFTSNNAFIGGNTAGYALTASGTTNVVSGLLGPGTITVSGKLSTATLGAGSHTLDVLIDTGAGGNNNDQLTSPQFTFTVTANTNVVTSTVSSSSNAAPVSVSSGGSTITIDFGSVASGGDVVVEQKTATDLEDDFPDIFDSVFDDIATLTVGSAEANTVGEIFDIDISALTVSGSFLVTIPYDPDLLPDGTDESDVKFLHWDGSAWEDVTESVDTSANTVTGELTALSPVVAGVQTGSTDDDDDDSSSGGGGGGGGGARSSGGIALPEPVDLTTYPDSYFVLHPLAKMQVLALTFINSQGVGTSQITEGQQVGIATTFKNYQDHDQTYAYIVQVEDRDGYSVSFNYQTGTLSAAATTISTAFTANESGVYTVKVFIWDSLGEAPTPLSEVGVTAINVVE